MPNSLFLFSVYTNTLNSDTLTTRKRKIKEQWNLTAELARGKGLFEDFEVWGKR